MGGGKGDRQGVDKQIGGKSTKGESEKQNKTHEKRTTKEKGY